MEMGPIFKGPVLERLLETTISKPHLQTPNLLVMKFGDRGLWTGVSANLLQTFKIRKVAYLHRDSLWPPGGNGEARPTVCTAPTKGDWLEPEIVAVDNS